MPGDDISRAKNAPMHSLEQMLMKLRSELQKIASAPSVEISSDEDEVLEKDDEVSVIPL
jgi:hypothetical protein